MNDIEKDDRFKLIKIEKTDLVINNKLSFEYSDFKIFPLLLKNSNTSIKKYIKNIKNHREKIIYAKYLISKSYNIIKFLKNIVNFNYEVIPEIYDSDYHARNFFRLKVYNDDISMYVYTNKHSKKFSSIDEYYLDKNCIIINDKPDVLNDDESLMIIYMVIAYIDLWRNHKSIAHQKEISDIRDKL